MKKESAKASAASEEYNYLNPCSAQDMTGLIPAGTVGDEELENYEKLYPFLPKVPEKNPVKAVKDNP